MYRRKLVIFSILNWLLAFAFIAGMVWMIYYSTTELSGNKQIINYVVGALAIVVVVADLHIMGGFLIIDEYRILVRFKLFAKTTVVPIEEVRMLYLCGKTLKAGKGGTYVTVIRANTKEGQILGFGFMAIRALVMRLNVPVHISEYNASVSINAKILLQKGKLSEYQAKMLMASSSWPKKYLNKWYNESKTGIKDETSF